MAINLGINNNGSVILTAEDIVPGAEYAVLPAVELDKLKQCLADLIDPDPCWFDHHGYCQAHGWLQDEECPHARARKLLSELDHA
jgi:hypothetical protein